LCIFFIAAAPVLSASTVSVVAFAPSSIIIYNKNTESNAVNIKSDYPSNNTKKENRTTLSFIKTSPDHVSLVGNSQAARPVAHTVFSSSSTVLQLLQRKNYDYRLIHSPHISFGEIKQTHVIW
jgi:hypothetical protein